MSFRQIPLHRLSEGKKATKLQMDRDYEIAVQNISKPFYQKKRTIGVTPAEEEAYRLAKKSLWGTYQQQAREASLYEEILPEEQLASMELRLQELLVKVNEIRFGLDKSPIKVTEEKIVTRD